MPSDALRRPSDHVIGGEGVTHDRPAHTDPLRGKGEVVDHRPDMRARTVETVEAGPAMTFELVHQAPVGAEQLFQSDAASRNAAEANSKFPSPSNAAIPSSPLCSVSVCAGQVPIQRTACGPGTNGAWS
ncbi:hypothetical protein [Pseudonocardia sp. ICBG601]|uniref:hypothetical protein n=1 Tax=Pseudonocardia sp. ICBG601 TaxID=2846759 RepID=UPI001CF67D8E|nr:hypothetical protein [Pseudonocardia sp. ICBG601]